MLQVTDPKLCAHTAVQLQHGRKQTACTAESHCGNHEFTIVFFCVRPISAGIAMHLIARALAFMRGAVHILLNGATWVCSRAMPNCTHTENSYSFPRTVAGKTTRTCCKCGHRREYDMTTMRFLTGRFVSTS